MPNNKLLSLRALERSQVELSWFWPNAAVVYPFWEFGGDPRDALFGTPNPVATGVAAWDNDGVVLDGTSYYQGTPLGQELPTTETTVAVLFKYNSASSDAWGGLFGVVFSDETNNSNLLQRRSSAGLTWNLNIGGTSLDTAAWDGGTNTIAFSDGEFKWYVARWASGQAPTLTRWSLTGILEATITHDTSPTGSITYDPTSAFNIGKARDAGNLAGTLKLGWISTKSYPDENLVRLLRNPFGLFRVPPRRLGFVASVGGVNAGMLRRKRASSQAF